MRFSIFPLRPLTRSPSRRADAVQDLYVINDSVNLALVSASSSLAISGILAVGVPASSTGLSFTFGNLSLTSTTVGSTGNFSAGSVIVGANNGTGVLTLGAATNLRVSGTTTIGAASLLTISPGGQLYTNAISLAGSIGAWTGKLDLGTSRLDLPGNSLATVNDMVKQGYSGGTWQGSGGIVSTAAAADSTHLTAVGVISNNVSGSALYGSAAPKGLFGGMSPGLNDVLVKYTYYGDTNLDGVVDGSDYSRIDATYLAERFTNGLATNPISGWFNGDFNYDGVVDGSDYTLMDNAFNQQGGAAVSPDALIAYTPNEIATFTATDIPLTSNGTSITAQSGPNLVGDTNPTALIAQTPVPEPVVVLPLTLGMLGLLSRRRSQTIASSGV